MKWSEQCPSCGRKMHHRVACRPIKKRVKKRRTSWDHILRGTL